MLQFFTVTPHNITVPGALHSQLNAKLICSSLHTRKPQYVHLQPDNGSSKQDGRSMEFPRDGPGGKTFTAKQGLANLQTGMHHHASQQHEWGHISSFCCMRPRHSKQMFVKWKRLLFYVPKLHASQTTGCIVWWIYKSPKQNTLYVAASALVFLWMSSKMLREKTNFLVEKYRKLCKWHARTPTLAARLCLLCLSITRLLERRLGEAVCEWGDVVSKMTTQPTTHSAVGWT